MINKPRVAPKSRPTHIYRCTPSNRAVRQLILLQSRWLHRPDARSSTGRAGPVTDRTRWSSQAAPQRVSDWTRTLDEPDATMPASDHFQ
jgi:hypothetical protein